MTKRNRHSSIWAGLVGVLLLLPVTRVSAQESGAEMWGRVCGRCHRIQPPNKYDADTWRAIMGHMALTARLTPQEEEGIREFLMGAARRVAENPEPRPERGELARVASADPNIVSIVISGSDSTPPERGAGVYRAQCRVCHGEKGKGDGPAAVGLTPRPSDLTRSERVQTMSDEELAEFLSVGKGTMPGFREILTAQDLSDVVEWVRSLIGSSK